ncbi:hypothetical protein MF271_24060 (plasmid) [Deinococcus sp. KNUC1210]|uniref:hypothetical protein n=1 Tax=Deinococcus sp. KNUC1210 TaxID=2917691 RepID=UPI001EF14A86|nr:hypothetical protein [Deinococcus sp. KNUC1210]ULH18038.1 hypothetical protein MF271_24060 [Deinococcus sp. KNUC1210]
MSSRSSAHLSTLTFSPVVREDTSISGEAVTKTRRVFLDFVIDGRSFWNTLTRPDFISFFGWLLDEQDEQAWVDRLLLRGPADLSNGRRSFYICPECGDLECGSYSAVMERSANTFVWRDIGFVWWDHQHEGHAETVELMEGFGPFVFDAAEYELAFERARRVSHELRTALYCTDPEE